jgi:hypothetical protein
VQPAACFRALGTGKARVLGSRAVAHLGWLHSDIFALQFVPTSRRLVAAFDAKLEDVARNAVPSWATSDSTSSPYHIVGYTNQSNTTFPCTTTSTPNWPCAPRSVQPVATGKRHDLSRTLLAVRGFFPFVLCSFPISDCLPNEKYLGAIQSATMESQCSCKWAIRLPYCCTDGRPDT